MAIRLLGFEISRRPVAGRWLPLMFVAMAVIAIFMALNGNGFFANERLGESILPKENQLIRTGPYVMEVINSTHARGVEFSSTTNPPNHFESWASFDNNKDDHISGLINSGDLKEAYLWTSNMNPLRKVWRIEANGHDILSFKRALSDYQAETGFVPNFMFGVSVLAVVLFGLSILKITRIKIQR